MAITADPNWVATLGAASLTGLITYIVARRGKNDDARSAAEAALIGSGPEIIRQMNERTLQLQQEISKLWERDRECHDDLDRMRRIVNERDFTIRELEQKLIAVDHKLNRLERRTGEEN